MTTAGATVYQRLRRQVLEQLDAERVDPSTDPRRVREVVDDLVAGYQRSADLGTDPRLRDAGEMARRLEDSVVAFGPLTDVLTSAEVEEVFIEGPRVTWMDRTGRLHGLAEPTSEEENRAVVDRLLAPTTRSLDTRNPMVQARVLDGRARLSAAIPPVAEALSATIRRHATRRHDLDGLVATGSLSQGAAALLRLVMGGWSSVVVSGQPGAGKTSLLAALLGAVPPQRCVRVCEEIRELTVPLTHGSYYEARPPSVSGEAEVSLRDLLKFCLGMRSDLIVVGEVRGAEAFELTRAVNAGCGFACQRLGSWQSFEALPAVGGSSGLRFGSGSDLRKCSVTAADRLERRRLPYGASFVFVGVRARYRRWPCSRTCRDGCVVMGVEGMSRVDGRVAIMGFGQVSGGFAMAIIHGDMDGAPVVAEGDPIPKYAVHGHVEPVLATDRVLTPYLTEIYRGKSTAVGASYPAADFFARLAAPSTCEAATADAAARVVAAMGSKRANLGILFGFYGSLEDGSPVHGLVKVDLDMDKRLQFASATGSTWSLTEVDRLLPPPKDKVAKFVIAPEPLGEADSGVFDEGAGRGMAAIYLLDAVDLTVPKTEGNIPALGAALRDAGVSGPRVREVLHEVSTGDQPVDLVERVREEVPEVDERTLTRHRGNPRRPVTTVQPEPFRTVLQSKDPWIRVEAGPGVELVREDGRIVLSYPDDVVLTESELPLKKPR